MSARRSSISDGGDTFSMARLQHVVMRLEAAGGGDPAELNRLDSAISRIENALDKLIGPDPNPKPKAAPAVEAPAPAVEAAAAAAASVRRACPPGPLPPSLLPRFLCLPLCLGLPHTHTHTLSRPART